MAPSFREAVEGAVEDFNRLHGAEARARILRLDDEGFEAEFHGSFCLTCGFYDYFDDLAHLVKERGYAVRVARVEEREDGAVVEYKIVKEGERVGERVQPERVVLIFEWSRGEVSRSSRAELGRA